MTRIIYTNGRYKRYDDAVVHAEDRGFQFGDAVYEVIEVKDSRLIDETRHMSRLSRSLSELGIRPPMPDRAWQRILREPVRRNRVRNGLVYLQVSRGASPRNFMFSGIDMQPTVVCLARSIDPAVQQKAFETGIRIITHKETRWARRDIKTVMLLPASLAKETAKAQGAQDVWFVDDDGMVLEGGSSNAWIVSADGKLLTRPADTAILCGITRLTLIDALKELNIQLVERAFSVEEALAAREAFITSATSLVMPIVQIDDRQIGDGRPGPIVRELRAAFHKVAKIAAP